MVGRSMQKGDRVNWAYTPRGGYGFTTKVAGIVEAITAKRVRIMVARKVDGRWVKESRSVMPEKLTPRQSSCVELGE